MLEKFLVLLERFVVAHELIAANSAVRTVTQTDGDLQVTITETVKEALNHNAEPVKELPVEGEDVIDAPAKKPRKAKPAGKPVKEPEDADLEDDEPAPQPKKKAKPEVDIAQMREDIKTIANHIGAGESDECADLFDELLEKYDVRTVPKLKEEQVEDFYKEARLLVSKYYHIED